MEDTYLYKDEYGNDCVFFRKQYRDLVFAIVTDFFEEPLPNNKFQKGFINSLDTLDDHHAVYHITGEMPFYWAICIIENEWTIQHLIKDKTNEEFMDWYKKYNTEHGIITFIKEGVHEEIHVFNDDEGGKGIFLRKRYYEFISSLVTDFFKKPLEHNAMNVELIRSLNAPYASKDPEYIDRFMNKPPYDWALSIIQDKDVTDGLDAEQLESYTEFLEGFHERNGMTSFVIPQRGIKDYLAKQGLQSLPFEDYPFPLEKE